MKKDMLQTGAKARILFTICSIVIYILGFLLLSHFYGQATAISTVIPVVVVGWYYGCKAGIITAILSFPMNNLMCAIVGFNWWEKVIVSGGGIAGTFALILIGAVVGRISDLSKKVKAQLYENNRDKEELKTTKDNLNNIIESSLDCIIVTDGSGTMTKVNRALLALLGCEEKEVIGKHIMELAPEEGVQYNSTTGEKITFGKEYFDEIKTMIYNELFEKMKITNWEGYYLRKDKQVVPIEQNVVYLFNEGGEITGSLGVIRDITERKKIEKEIRETKDFLENVFRTSADGIVITDNRGCITMMNEAIENVLGYSKDELLGKHPAELTPEGEEYKDQARRFFTTLTEKGIVIGFERNWQKKDGSVADIAMSAAFLRNKGGENIGGVMSIRDITARKRTEKEVSEAKEFLESVIENSKDGILIADDMGYIMFVNNALLEMSGYKKGEVIGKHAFIFAVEDKEMMEKVMEATAEMYEKGFAIYESQVKNIKNSRITDLECTTSLIKDDKGNNIAGVGIMRDMTERKKMEQQLLQSEKLKSLGELAGGVAHDFNNVLAAILGRAQLLKMDFDPPPGVEEKRKSMLELMESIEVIEQAARDGAETVRRIQEFARRRDDDKNFKTVDINEVITNALEFTKVRWGAEAQARGVAYTIQKEFFPLPPTLGSAAELREVFTNLINNALDAMPQGGNIKIKTSKQDSHAAVEFSDTGCGIPKSIKNRIFDPFFTTKGVQSTGLGMSVSYGMISRHRGTIKVDSIENQGTTFTITLPISDKTLKEEKREAMPEEEQRKARILVIEDEKEVRRTLVSILTKSGHEVETSSDGSTGIGLFKKKEFDLVFTDLGMPGMSGWQVAEKVKVLNGRVPVAVITGWNVELSESEIKDKCVDLIIQKPFEVKQVLRLVQEGMILKDRFKAA